MIRGEITDIVCSHQNLKGICSNQNISLFSSKSKGYRKHPPLGDIYIDACLEEIDLVMILYTTS